MSEQSPTAAGKSSYDLIDTDHFWKVLPLAPGMTVLDLACGAGRYTLPLSARVGASGRVIAVDLWSEGIDQLREALYLSGIKNVETHLADATRPLPLASASVDLCLMATVLHDFTAEDSDRAVIAEVARILTPEGILAVVEFIKQDGPPGPPKTVRLSLGEVSAKLQPFGLIRFGAVVELGRHTYYAQFRRLRSTPVA
jgi:ubiquinone/menaquinone biosynthesis C-methylase UbiE